MRTLRKLSLALSTVLALWAGMGAATAQTLSLATTLGSGALDEWAPAQRAKALSMLAAQQLANGAVIASPSRQDPDYYYHWTRDAALVMVAQLQHVAASGGRSDPQPFLERIAAYLRFSEDTQEAPNRSGGVEGYLNLGEPKFYVDGRGFDGDWGRPQSDGPALRAILICKLKRLADTDARVAQGLRSLGLTPVMETVLRRDLDYVVAHWRDASFDIWEEVRGGHFYNRLVQYRALAMGATYYQIAGLRSLGADYDRVRGEIAATLERFWSNERGYLLATIDRDGGVDYKSSNLDAAIVLAALHASDSSDPLFAPSDDRILATAAKLDATFSAAFPINRTTRDPSGLPLAAGIGRYPEDRYDGVGFSGGHGWFITTLALSELCYRTADAIERNARFVVSERSLGFLRLAAPATAPSLSSGTVLSGNSLTLRQLARELRTHGDSYLARVRYHAGRDGSMAEQFNRESGFMRGARDLTWSYAALLTAVDARLH